MNLEQNEKKYNFKADEPSPLTAPQRALCKQMRDSVLTRGLLVIRLNRRRGERLYRAASAARRSSLRDVLQDGRDALL